MELAGIRLGDLIGHIGVCSEGIVFDAYVSWLRQALSLGCLASAAHNSCAGGVQRGGLVENEVHVCSESGILNAAAVDEAARRYGCEIDWRALLGAGTYGEVRKARISISNEICVVKSVCSYADGASELALQRGRRHAHVCAAYGSFASKDAHHLVLELCAGGDLFDYLSAQGILPHIEATRLLHQFLDAVAFVNAAGIVHCDRHQA